MKDVEGMVFGGDSTYLDCNLQCIDIPSEVEDDFGKHGSVLHELHSRQQPHFGARAVFLNQELRVIQSFVKCCERRSTLLTVDVDFRVPLLQQFASRADVIAHEPLTQRMVELQRVPCSAALNAIDACEDSLQAFLGCLTITLGPL